MRKYIIFIMIFIISIISVTSISFADDNLPSLSTGYGHVIAGDENNDEVQGFDSYVRPLFSDKGATSTVINNAKASVDEISGRINKTSIDDVRKESLNKSLNSLYTVVRNATTLVMVFGILTSIIVALWNFFKMAFMPSHPMQRRNCLETIASSSVVAILLSGLTLIMNVLIGTFQGSFTSSIIYANDWRVAGVVFLAQYRDVIVGFFGIITMSMVLALAWQFMNLVLAGGNPQKKSAAITGILITAAATAGVGGIMTVMSILTGLVGA